MIDARELQEALERIVGTRPFEIRVLNGVERAGGKALTWFGYFDDASKVAGALERLRGGWHGVYFTPNPVDSALLHRCHNRIQVANRGETTTDANVVARRWLLCDFDPIVRGDTGLPVKGIAATDGEKSAALQLARDVRAFFASRGWPMPILADSGNGYHLLWRCDLPAASDLPKRWLDALADSWADRCGDVTIDVSIANPARIWKLYGTRACKGAGVGDRPHRMARIVEAPDGDSPVDPSMLEAFVQECEPAPATTATTAPAAPVLPRPAYTGGGETTFDPLQLVAAAGLSLGEPKRRASGDTVREFSGACPCGKLKGNDARGSYLVVGDNGAVGLGCRHATCQHSDSQRKPGDSWRAWRAEHDPSYSPDGAGAAVAVTVARGDSIAARLARPSNDGVDLGGFISEGAAVQTEASAPVAPARRHRDARRSIDVKADHFEIRRQTLEVLAADPSLYVAHGELSRISDGYRMAALAGGALDAFVASRCAFVKFQEDKATSTFVGRPEPLPLRVLKMLEALLPEDLPAFREVEAVTRAPFFTASGVLCAAQGHNRESRTLIVDCPEIDRSPLPDGSFALEALRDVVRDFPFEGGVYGPECANWIGALLAPMVRPMIHGPMPMLLIEANRPGTGKTLLAQLIQVVYGLPDEVGPMQRDEAAFAKQLLSILREHKPVHVFDNVKHAVVSQSLDMVLTSETYTDRVLGESRSLHLRVLTLWIMTSNNARLSADMVRRMLRCRLVSPVENPEERTDLARPDLLRWAATNRGEILSWLVQLVDEWLLAGAPLAADLPRLGSFESFSSVIGSILAFHGERQWLGNLRAAKQETQADDELQPFLAAWYNDPFFRTSPMRAKQLHELAIREGLLGNLLSHGNEASQWSRLGNYLRQLRDTVQHGFLISMTKDGHSSQSVYRISPVPGLRAVAN